MATKDTAFNDFKNDADTRIEKGGKRHTDGIAYLDRVDRDLSFFKNYCDNMKLSEISDLFSTNIEENDLLNDNG